VGALFVRCERVVQPLLYVFEDNSPFFDHPRRFVSRMILERLCCSTDVRWLLPLCVVRLCKLCIETSGEPGILDRITSRIPQTSNVLPVYRSDAGVSNGRSLITSVLYLRLMPLNGLFILESDVLKKRRLNPAQITLTLECLAAETIQVVRTPVCSFHKS
jgi:hypothetical protein